jgi:hypothetical protein
LKDEQESNEKRQNEEPWCNVLMNGNMKGENDSFTGCENDDETGKAGRDRLEVRGAGQNSFVHH